MAIAHEGKARGVTGKTFIKKYHLQTVSVVTAAIRGLLENSRKLYKNPSLTFQAALSHTYEYGMSMATAWVGLG